MGRVAPTRDATILAAPENSLCQWQSALGDRDHAVARTMQKRERDDSGSTERTRNAAPIGCSAEASRVEEIGWNERNNRNSTMRAPTWAWPTSDAAAIAALEDAPAACSNPGKCAAIAPCTNQVAAKKKARIGIAARDGGAAAVSVVACGSAAGTPWRGIASQLTGAASSMCKPAQTRQVARQPNSCRNNALSGQLIVLAKRAMRVIPVIELRASRP